MKKHYNPLKNQVKNYWNRITLFLKKQISKLCTALLLISLTAHAEEGKEQSFDEIDQPRTIATSFSIQEEIGSPLIASPEKRELQKIEQSRKRLFRWITLDTLLQKIGYGVVLRRVCGLIQEKIAKIEGMG